MTAPVAGNSAHATVVPVKSGDVGRFIRVPGGIFRDDPHWVPPLLLERRMHLSPSNPYFKHARWQSWIAYRGATPVGRISAQVDQLHLDRYGDDTGFFGMLDAEDDPQTVTSLFDAAEAWLREQGMRRVRGPFSLSINDETGLLVDGFQTPPMVMMGHARPYYAQHVAACGYDKAVDVLAYMITPDFERSPTMSRLLDRVGGDIRVRPLRRKHFDQELETLRDIFNDAWSDNWGFVPFTRDEFEELGKNLKLLVDDDFIQIAEVAGEPAAFIATLPNINEAIRDLNGRLLPLGWLKLLWRLKVGYPKTARIPLMGVRKKFHHGRLGPALAFLVIEALRDPVMRRGIEQVELSWILENNEGMRHIIESIGGRMYKRYRIYEKDLTAP